MESSWSIKLCALEFFAVGAGRLFSLSKEFNRTTERHLSVETYVHGGACLRENCMCKCGKRTQFITPSGHQSVIHKELNIWYPQ